MSDTTFYWTTPSKQKFALLLIIYLIIYSVQYISKTKDYIDENWRKIRCYPHIIPIAGFSKYAKGNGILSKTYNNFNSCTNKFVKTSVSTNSKPTKNVIKKTKKGLFSINTIINSFRNMAAIFRKMFSTLVGNTVKRLSNSYAAIIFFQEKMKVIIKKQSAIFEVISQFAATLPMIIYSFTHGPIARFGYFLNSFAVFMITVIIMCGICKIPFFGTWACPVCAICFPGDTLIDIDDDTKKYLKDIKIGDKIKNTTVIGKLFVKPHIADTYNYKGITVSGSHMVFENNKWIRIEDSELSEIETKYTELYCLITENNTISINGIKFRDYQENKDIDILLTTNYLFAKQINSNLGCIKTDDDKDNCYYWGFAEDAMIEINKNKYVKIKNIIDNPNDYDNIRGIVEIDTDYKLYDYKGIKVSGNTLVYENNIWVRVFQSPQSKLIDNNNKLYHLIVDDNLVIAKSNDGSVIFRDFIESNNEEVNDKVDNLVIDRLNLMFNFEK